MAYQGFRSGPPEVLDFVRGHGKQWQWWDNPEIERPLVSMVVLRPEESLEVGRPEGGVAIRVRCAWENTPQGLAKQPLAELVALTLDGAETEPTLIARRRPNGLYEEHCHLLNLPTIAPGKHTAAVTVRDLKTKSEFRRTVEFVV